MADQMTNVPPAVPLLLTEVLARAGTEEEAIKRLRDLLPELQAQSEFYMVDAAKREGAVAPVGRLDIYLDGGLNLFGLDGACAALPCRIAGATRLARSMGLLADNIWMTDFLSERFLDFGEPTDDALSPILDDLMVIEELWPLISAGIVKFRTPWVALCQGCKSNFDDEVEELTDLLVDRFLNQFEIERMKGGGLAVVTGDAYHPSVVYRMGRTRSRKRPPALRDLARSVVFRAVHDSLWSAREASFGHGSVFSNSRIGLAGLAAKDGRIHSRADYRVLDKAREVALPWVSELTPSQIVELRTEASQALPLLREMMSNRLVYSGGDAASQNGDDMIAQLRYQAVELRGELELINKRAERFWGKPFALLGLGISALGLATDEPLAAAGGLLGLLELLTSHRVGSEHEAEKARCKPGYVLVKAQDLLAHNH